MKKIAFFVLAYFFVFCSFVSADILHLKNGRILRGRTLEETAYSVKFLTTNNEPHFYYKHEISRLIKEDGVIPEEDGVPEGKKELILKLFDVTNTQEKIREILLKVEKEAPEKIRNDFKRLMDAGEIVDLLIPIYTQYYTEEDLKELIPFFENPVVQKHFQLGPVVSEASIKVILEYIENKSKSSK